MQKILLSPHNDDEALFASFTCIREKPLVIIVTDSWKQFNRGDNITAEQRRKESSAAMRMLGCEVQFLGIPDTKLTLRELRGRLSEFRADIVYAPAIQHGNKDHDTVGRAALACFNNVIQYSTYEKNNLYTTGEIEVTPTPEELTLKGLALDCYQSQISYYRTAPHFSAVRGKSEWITQHIPWRILQKTWNRLAR